MSIFEADYDSGSSNNNNDDDYEERDSLKLDKYGIVEFEISRIAEFSGQQYGQSLIVDIDDVKASDGLVYDRNYVPEGKDRDEYEDDTIKLFGYNKWFRTDENGKLDEEVDEELVNKRITEEHAGDQYPYEFVERTTEEDEDLDLGNLVMWLSNSPKNRTVAQVLLPQGQDAVHKTGEDADGNAEYDKYDWLTTEDPQLRDDLKGRRITMTYRQTSFTPEGQDEEVSYVDAALFDAGTGAPIKMVSGGDGSDETEDVDDDAGGSVGGGNDGGTPEGVPEEANQIIDFMARTNETNPENVEQFMEGEVDGKEFDTDAVIAEIEARR